MTPPPQFSDEPHILAPQGRDYRLPCIIAFALLLAGTFLYIQFMNSWKEEQSHLAVRGQYQGAVHTIEIYGQEMSIELAWVGPHIGIIMDSRPTEDAIVRIQGSFGKEILTWDEEHSLFGPTETTVDPYGHYKVKIIIESNEEILWSGKKWAWGIHSHHH